MRCTYLCNVCNGVFAVAGQAHHFLELGLSPLPHILIHPDRRLGTTLLPNRLGNVEETEIFVDLACRTFERQDGLGDVDQRLEAWRGFTDWLSAVDTQDAVVLVQVARLDLV